MPSKRIDKFEGSGLYDFVMGWISERLDWMESWYYRHSGTHSTWWTTLLPMRWLYRVQAGHPLLVVSFEVGSNWLQVGDSLARSLKGAQRLAIDEFLVFVLIRVFSELVNDCSSNSWEQLVIRLIVKKRCKRWMHCDDVWPRGERHIKPWLGAKIKSTNDILNLC